MKEKMTIQLNTVCTPSQKAQIDKCVKDSGISQGAWVRAACKEKAERQEARK